MGKKGGKAKKKSKAKGAKPAPPAPVIKPIADESTSEIDADELNWMRDGLLEIRTAKDRNSASSTIQNVHAMAGAVNDFTVVLGFARDHPGADLNQVLHTDMNSPTRTILHSAAFHGHYLVVWALLQSGAVFHDVNDPDSVVPELECQTELWSCCNAPFWQPASSNVPPELQDYFAQQPPRNYARTARLLVEAGADLNRPVLDDTCPDTDVDQNMSANLVTPLAAACQAFYEYGEADHEADVVNLVQYLLSAGANPNPGIGVQSGKYPPELKWERPLEGVICAKNDALGALLVSAGAKVRGQERPYPYEDVGLLEEAARQGMVKTIHALLTSAEWQALQATDEAMDEEEKALVNACFCGHAAVVGELLKYGKDIDFLCEHFVESEVNDFINPVEAAVKSGSCRTLEVLLEDAVNHSCRKDVCERYALEWVVKAGDEAMLMLLQGFHVSVETISTAVSVHAKENRALQQFVHVLSNPALPISPAPHRNSSSGSGPVTAQLYNTMFPTPVQVLTNWRAAYQEAKCSALPQKQEGGEHYKAGRLQEALQCYTRGLFQFPHRLVDAERLRALLLGTNIRLGAASAVRLLRGRTDLLKHLAPFLHCIGHGELQMQTCAAECASNASLMLLKLGQPKAAFLRAQMAFGLDVTFYKSLRRMGAAAQALPSDYFQQQALECESAASQIEISLRGFNGWLPGGIYPPLIHSPSAYAALEQERADTEMRVFRRHVLTFPHGEAPLGPQQVQVKCSMVPHETVWSRDGQWLLFNLEWVHPSDKTSSTFDKKLGCHKIWYIHLTEADNTGAELVELPPNGRTSPAALAFCRRRIKEFIAWFREHFYSGTFTLLLGQALFALERDAEFGAHLPCGWAAGIDVRVSDGTHASRRAHEDFSYDTDPDTLSFRADIARANAPLGR
jgi:hypothetical protein